jgi:hypothetical protein
MKLPAKVNTASGRPTELAGDDKTTSHSPAKSWMGLENAGFAAIFGKSSKTNPPSNPGQNASTAAATKRRTLAGPLACASVARIVLSIRIDFLAWTRTDVRLS